MQYRPSRTDRSVCANSNRYRLNSPISYPANTVGSRPAGILPRGEPPGISSAFVGPIPKPPIRYPIRRVFRLDGVPGAISPYSPRWHFGAERLAARACILTLPLGGFGQMVLTCGGAVFPDPFVRPPSIRIVIYAAQLLQITVLYDIV